jgi:hypothetical protein
MQPYILSIGNSYWVLGILTALLLAGVWINKWSKKKIIVKLLIVLLNIVCTFLYFSYETTNLKVVKVISEYVWYDTFVELDKGWIDF